jgi:hypothetical protein
VTSNSPAVTLIVEYSSHYSSKLHSGQVIETVLRLCRATALSGSVPPNFEGSVSGNSQSTYHFGVEEKYYMAYLYRKG